MDVYSINLQGGVFLYRIFVTISFRISHVSVAYVS